MNCKLTNPLCRCTSCGGIVPLPHQLNDPELSMHLRKNNGQFIRICPQPQLMCTQLLAGDSLHM